MSRKLTKSILSIDEVNLLINSEEPKNVQLYGNLYEVLCGLKNRKAITLNELTDLDEIGKGALSYNKKNLMGAVIKEWYAERSSAEDPKKKVRCGLCNTPNKYLYYIRNRKNGILLNVGSYCITKFPGIEGYMEQKQQLAEIKKNQEKVFRRNEFYSRFPNPESTISNAEKYFTSLPILLPYDTYTDLEETIKRMRLIYSKYVNDGKKAFESEYDSFYLFELAVIKFEKLQKQANMFVSNNIRTPNICKRREIDWMIASNRMLLLEKISHNSGRYTKDTLRQMQSYDFVKENMELFVSKNTSSLFDLQRIESAEFIFLFKKFGYQSPISFSVSLTDFMYNIGAECIAEDNYTYSSKEIHKNSKIRYTNSNLTSILNYVDDMINKMNCVFMVDSTTNSLFLYRKGDKAIRSFKINVFMDSYSKYILSSDQEIKKWLFNLVKGNMLVKWITAPQQKMQGIDNKIYSLYKEYRESNAGIMVNKIRVLEILVYHLATNNVNNNYEIDFDRPEYFTIQRAKIKAGNNRIRQIDYGIIIPDNKTYPPYNKGDILLVDNTQNIVPGDTIFYLLNGNFIIERTPQDITYKNIFAYLKVSKKNIYTYGRVVCCLKASDV